MSAGEIYPMVGAPSRSAITGLVNRRKLQRGQKAEPRVWTPELTREATKRWLSGETAQAIADALGDGLTRAAVDGHMRRLGIRKPSTGGNRLEKRASWGQGSVSIPVPPALNLVARADAPATGGKTLFERGPRECCWPVGAPDPRRGQLYCAAPVRPGKAYCLDHNPAQAAVLKDTRLKDPTIQRRRPEIDREPCDIELTEMFG